METRSLRHGLLIGFLAALAWPFLAAAAPAEPDGTEKPAPAAPADASLGTVFGRIAVVDKKGKALTFKDSFWATNHFSVLLLSRQTGTLKKERVFGDGSFVWSLAPGEYVLAGFTGFVDGKQGGRLWGSFEVGPAPQAGYIGTVPVALHNGYYEFGLIDDYEEALEKLGPQLQSAGREPAKALLAFEGKLGDYERVSGICATEWGLECGQKFAGVEALKPESGSAQNFPVTDSLSPAFEWKPSPRPEVTYDFVLYETLEMGGMEGTRLRGDRVAYAESLAEPRFELPAPLKPGTKYQWSVRLREGSKVSSWSTQGFFAFFVVGFASGHGYWFQFQTP